MCNELEVIINNLKDSFDGKPWYGNSVMHTLRSIPWQIANNKTYGSKSIAILVQHIISWRIFVLKRLEGDVNYDIIIDGENDWDEIHINNQEEWHSLIMKLQNTQDNLLHMLSKQTNAILQQQVTGKDYNFGPILTSIAQHDIYHLGQIAMLNAMQKS